MHPRSSFLTLLATSMCAFGQMTTASEPQLPVLSYSAVTYAVPDSPTLNRSDDWVLFSAGQFVSGPNQSFVGGPNQSFVGEPNRPAIGAASGRESFAPTRSSDAQVIIYRQDSLFESTGVTSLQTLPSPPKIEDSPWLVPVGQAYLVQSDDTVTAPRTISINYLQRDIPEGYEHTLAVYLFTERDG